MEVLVANLRAAIDDDNLPFELADAKFLLLVDHASGGMLDVTLFESAEAMRIGDAAMNKGPGNAGTRSAAEFYEVPIHTLWRAIS